jgi:hypothetical protein
MGTMLRARRCSWLAVVAASLAGGCATGFGGTPGGGTDVGPGPVAAAEAGRSIATHEHIDLWLHGYAMLTSDTARVPLFARGYRQFIREVRTKRGVYTQLDANAENLSARFRVNPSLVNGQFIPFYFSSFQEIQQVTSLFLRAGGDPRAASDPTTQQLIAVLAAAFPSPADRDWLRLFVQSLADENTHFYQSYWSSEQTARAATRETVDSIWRKNHARFQRFLNNTQQANGEIILSLPLGGEGRTVALSKQQSEVAVGFPATPAEAMEAIYVFAHETVNAITATAITDNISPAEQRAGAVGRYSANANVRGGALLLQRAAPELASGYMRYYLRTAGLVAPAGDPTSAFTAAFPIPDAIRDAVARQLDVVLGGI